MILLVLKRSLTADDALANYNQGPGKLSELLKGRDLSLEGFKRLMCSDTTFGGFGIPVPQYDAFLRVMAATSFQPYDASVLANEHDVLFLLTPIVRLLTTEWAVLMKMTDFEGKKPRLFTSLSKNTLSKKKTKLLLPFERIVRCTHSIVAALQTKIRIRAATIHFSFGRGSFRVVHHVPRLCRTANNQAGAFPCLLWTRREACKAHLD